jgi:hypothetical protein
MKGTETKQKFIELRADGKSLRKCASQLHMSKTTCSEWDKELAVQIASRKNERLEELYKEYGMVKEARIKRLGVILQCIDDAINKEINDGYLRHIPLKDLLALRREYQKDLNAEYTPAATPADATEANAVRASFMAFMVRVQSGEVTPKEMKVQAEAFAAMMVADKATQPPVFDLGI